MQKKIKKILKKKSNWKVYNYLILKYIINL